VCSPKDRPARNRGRGWGSKPGNLLFINTYNNDAPVEAAVWRHEKTSLWALKTSKAGVDHYSQLKTVLRAHGGDYGSGLSKAQGKLV